MNLRDLEYIVAVSEERHFGRAARHCHVSQPTLSGQIRKLEDYLGTPLFERQGKKVLVTPTGEQVLVHAKRLLAEYRQIQEVARQAGKPDQGRIRLGAFPTLAAYLLPILVPDIHQHYPKLQLILREEKTDSLLQALTEGDLDAALLALPVNQSHLSVMPLFREPFVLAVHTAHPLAKRSRVTLADLDACDLILLDEGHCLRDQALSVCHLANAREQSEFRATSLETLKQMVAGNIGITLVPALAVDTNPGVRYLPFQEDPPSREVGLVWRSSASNQAFIRTLGDRMITATRDFRRHGSQPLSAA